MSVDRGSTPVFGYQFNWIKHNCIRLLQVQGPDKIFLTVCPQKKRFGKSVLCLLHLCLSYKLNIQILYTVGLAEPGMQTRIGWRFQKSPLPRIYTSLKDLDLSSILWSLDIQLFFSRKKMHCAYQGTSAVERAASCFFSLFFLPCPCLSLIVNFL